MTEPQEPMLVSSMRRRPNGEVRLVPDIGPMAGTTTLGFLNEFDDYIEAVKSEARMEGYEDGESSGYNHGWENGYDTAKESYDD